MATAVDQPAREISTIGLQSLYKNIRLQKLTASANACGVLTAVLGYVFNAAWAHYTKAFLSTREILGLSYTVGAYVYVLFSRSNRSIAACLGFAGLMFAEGKVTATEYKSMRAHCLKKGGFVGKEA